MLLDYVDDIGAIHVYTTDTVTTGSYTIRVTGANDADYQDPQISKSIQFIIEIYEPCEN